MSDAKPTPNLVLDIDVQGRSKKFRALSDEEIIELSLGKHAGKVKIYLDREIEHRQLSDKVKAARHKDTKTTMFNKPWWQIAVPIVVSLFFLSKKLGGNISF